MPDLQEVKKQTVNQRKGCSGRGLAHAKILRWKVSGELFWGRNSKNVRQRGKDGHKNVSAESRRKEMVVKILDFLLRELRSD